MKKECTGCHKEFETENEEDVLCQTCLEKKVNEDKQSNLAKKEGYLTQKEIDEGKVEVQRINYLLKRERMNQEALNTKIADLEKEKKTAKEAEMGDLEKAQAEAKDLKVANEKLEADKLGLEHKNLIHSVLMKTKHSLKGLYLDKVGGETKEDIVQSIKQLEVEQVEFIKAVGGKEEEEEEEEEETRGPRGVNPKPIKKKGKENLGEKKAKEQFKDRQRRKSGYENDVEKEG